MSGLHFTSSYRYAYRCDVCGKGAYESRRDAKRAARDIHPHERLNAYRCPHRAGMWHLGHLRPGDRDRSIRVEMGEAAS